MDKERLRNKVMGKLLASPWTVVPAAMGITGLAAGWAGDSATLAFAGFAACLASVGALATRWMFKVDDLSREAAEEMEAEERRQHEESLNALDRRLQRDKDPSTEQRLRKLRYVYRRFQEASDWRTQVDRRSAFEIANKVEKLFKACIMALERSVVLWETAQRMTTRRGRDNVLASREKVLEDVDASVIQLARTIDGVLSLAVESSGESDLANLRSELNESLDVARRVEERMHSLETELRGSAESELRREDAYDRDGT